MNTKFYPPINRGGGQLIFVTTLLLAMLPIFSFGQPGLYEIYGESLWRNQSYGVSNHQFDIENYITTYSTNYPLDPDPITGSCPYEFYTSEDMPLYNVDEDDQVNTLK
jgi:hypothetical protein